MFSTVHVIGHGRAGSAINARLVERGHVVAGRDDAELVVLCVPDRAIAGVARRVPVGCWIAHVSGATPLETLVTLAITGQDPRTAENPYAPLTRREAEIAALVADGLSSRAIAERLTLSERTVQGHIQNTLDKLHASSRAGIAAWYVRRSPQQ